MKYFAVSFESVIYLYSMWSMKVLNVFNGHNARIKNLKWSLDDKKLYSCGMDGKLNIWNIVSGRNEHLFQADDQRFNSIACSDEKIQRIMTIGKEGNLFIMSFGIVLGNIIDTQITLNVGRLLKKVEWISSMNILIACNYILDFELSLATESDSLLLIEFDAKFQEFKIINEVSVGNSCISFFTVSADERYIFLTTEDGYLWTFDILGNLQDGRKERAHYFSDELLIKRADMGQYDKTVTVLKSKIEAMTFEHENAKVVKDEQQGFRLNDMSCKFVVEIDNLKGVIHSQLYFNK